MKRKIQIDLEEEKRTIPITEKIMKKVKIMGVLNLTPDSFYDGDKDLLIGNSKGLIIYYENQGDKSRPHFVLRNLSLIHISEPTRPY